MKKKMLSLALSLAMVVSLTGLSACGGSPDGESSAPPDGAQSTQSGDAPADDTVYQFVATTHVPGGGTAGQVFKAVLDEITRRSGGRIQFELYTDGTLSDAAGVLDCLDSGMADVAMLNYSRLNGRMDLVGVSSLPGLFSNSWEAMNAMIDLMDANETMQSMLAGCGIRVMGIQLGTQTVIMAKEEIDDLTDLAGKTVISGSNAINSVLQAVKANPVSFANSEAYEAVS